MAEDTAPATSAGGDWQLDAGFAARDEAGSASSFYALYNGADFAAPERGYAAIIAAAHPGPGPAGAGARDAAQLAVHGFAEGYFGIQRTLSTRRAAGNALTALNRWFAGQMLSSSAQPMVPVSLSALLLHQRRIGIAQIGICQLYRLRDGVLTPLIRPHLRLGQPGQHPARALGLEDDLATGHEEDEAALGDVYLLLANAGAPDAVYTALSDLAEEQFADAAALARFVLAAVPGLAPAIMALRVLALPPATEHNAAAQLAHLPIRPAPKEGDVWDDFLIGKTLFRGRYTILKTAYDRIARREVALKIPLKAMLQDEIFTAGFMREAWIGTAMRGSNVVHYIDLPPDRRSSLYLVMPLYRGETLEARLNRAPLVNLPEGMGIALKLCEAVQDLAAIQVIHRDIKPDNVMLLRERGEVRLLDLGLAYLPGIDAADALKPGGTIRYMAPELLQGTPASPRTEVYALAVTIYRMFSGGPFPFGQREPQPLARLRPDLPYWLGLVLARALSATPDERYENAGALAASLQTGLAEGVEANPAARRGLITTLRFWQILAALLAFANLLLAGHLLK